MFSNNHSRGVGKCEFKISSNIQYLYNINCETIRLKYLIINQKIDDSSLDFIFEMYYYNETQNKIILYNINISDITENNIVKEIKDNYIEYIINIEDNSGIYINTSFLRGYYGLNCFTINVILHTKNNIDKCKIGLKTLYYKSDYRNHLSQANINYFIEQSSYNEIVDIIDKNNISSPLQIILPLQINQETELKRVYNGFRILNIYLKKSFIDNYTNIDFNLYVKTNDKHVIKIPFAVIPDKNIQMINKREFIIKFPYTLSKDDYTIYLNSDHKFKFLFETSNNILDVNLTIEFVKITDFIHPSQPSPFSSVNINQNYYKNIDEINNFVYNNIDNTYSFYNDKMECGFTFGIFVEIENYKNTFNELKFNYASLEMFIINKQTYKIFTKHISKNVFYYPFDLESNIDNNNNILYNEGILKILSGLSIVVKLKDNYIPKNPIKVYLLSFRHNTHVYTNNINGYNKKDHETIENNYIKTNQYKILEYFREKNMLWDDTLKLITQFL